MAKNKTANVFTDSAYAHGVCHMYGAIWRQRGFKKTDSTPIQHQEQIIDLISTMMQLTKLAIIKCQAHRKGNDDVIRANNAADEAAKLVTKSEVTILTPVVSLEPVVTPEDIILIQQKAVWTTARGGEVMKKIKQLVTGRHTCSKWLMRCWDSVRFVLKTM